MLCDACDMVSSYIFSCYKLKKKSDMIVFSAAWLESLIVFIFGAKMLK